MALVEWHYCFRIVQALHTPLLRAHLVPKQRQSFIQLTPLVPPPQLLQIRFNTENKFTPEQDYEFDEEGNEIEDPDAETLQGQWFEAEVSRDGVADTLCFKCLAFEGSLMIDDVMLHPSAGDHDVDTDPCV